MRRGDRHERLGDTPATSLGIVLTGAQGLVQQLGPGSPASMSERVLYSAKRRAFRNHASGGLGSALICRNIELSKLEHALPALPRSPRTCYDSWVPHEARATPFSVGLPDKFNSESMLAPATAPVADKLMAHPADVV